MTHRVSKKPRKRVRKPKPHWHKYRRKPICEIFTIVDQKSYGILNGTHNVAINESAKAYCYYANDCRAIAQWLEKAADWLEQGEGK